MLQMDMHHINVRCKWIDIIFVDAQLFRIIGRLHQLIAWIGKLICIRLKTDSLKKNVQFLNSYDIKNVEILVGTRDILNGGIYHKIDKWEIHENYHDNCGNNIGAVRVKQSFDFNEKVGPIELETEEIAEGTELEFTAFGHRELSNYPRRLQIVKLNVSNHDECKQTYNSITCKVGPQHLCTFSKRTGSCEVNISLK